MSGPANDPGPPPRIEALVGRLLPADVRAGVLGDLHELHRSRAERGALRATWWYARHGLAVGIGYRIRELSKRVRRGPGPGARRAWLSDVARDVRHGARGFLREPGLLVAALVTLALGIGANTAMFSVIHGIYLEPLPYDEPDRIVRIGLSRLDGTSSMAVHTAGSFTAWRARATSFESMAAYGYRTVVAERGDAERLFAALSIGSVFDVLGVSALMGRTFDAAEEAPGAERLVVLSHDYWTRAFGGEDPVGRTLRLDGAPYEIIGVMPPDFTYPSRFVDVWITADLDAERLQAHDDYFLRTVARLRPGRSLEAARDEMADIAAGVASEVPEASDDVTAEVMLLRDLTVRSAGSLWAVLMVGVGVVLLIGCLNLANLLLSRSARRRREMGVRRALGATRGRLVRQVLAESLLLSTLGALGGLAMGWWFLQALLAWMPGGVPRSETVGFDPAVWAFTAGVAGLAGLFFGAFPAFDLGRATARAGPSRVSPRSALVAVEFALAVLLLAAGGLTLRSVISLAGEDPGVAISDRVAFPIEWSREGSADEYAAFLDAVEDRLAAVPGVRSFGLASTLPVVDFTPGAWINVPGAPDAGAGDRPTAKYQAVTPDYFATLDIPLLRGRPLGPDDGLDGEPSVLISETAAVRLFPGEDPIGRSFDMGLEGSIAPLATVVGVVGDVKLSGLDAPASPAVYGTPDLMPWWRGYEAVLHVEDAGALAAAREALRSVGPELALLPPRDVEQEVTASMGATRGVSLLFAILAAVALAMAAVGVSGLVAFHVSQRGREIGIRIAVGAEASSVRRLLVVQGMRPALFGSAVGLTLAVVGGDVIASLLHGVAPTDPLTLTAVVLVLLGAAWVCISLPARRASRLAPVGVLADDA